MKRHAWKHGEYAPDRENPRSPKRWSRPRSYRWRDEQYPAPPPASPGEAARILKHLYSAEPQPIFDRPAWAKVAYKFGWLTRRAFWAVPTFNTGRMTPGLKATLHRNMYELFPILGIVKKGPA